jgi:hypothetical protein
MAAPEAFAPVFARRGRLDHPKRQVEPKKLLEYDRDLALVRSAPA